MEKNHNVERNGFMAPDVQFLQSALLEKQSARIGVRTREGEGGRCAGATNRGGLGHRLGTVGPSRSMGTYGDGQGLAHA